MKRILPFIIILVVLGVALTSAWYLTRSIPASPVTSGGQPSPTAPSSQASPAEQQPVANGVPGAEPPHVLGSATAPLRLEEFGDFECPPCGMFHPILEQMHAEFGDKLQITFREFPLVPTHQHALAAASAAEAAGLQNKFWEMHDLLYVRQNDWKKEFDVRPVFEGYAKEIGLDVERYKRDAGSDLVAQRIFQDGKRGHSLGVKGTPTVFLNGREVPFENLPADKLRVVIQNELRSAGR
ncbi:MAG TPA: thioredoxin domain-containing protein [Pyrinomonadaceae bacterium]|jgi:protein-disulfide isomerase|nr:thioredoxin domain-containing protein [Pyrinomonadaceae bacterium]